MSTVTFHLGFVVPGESRAMLLRRITTWSAYFEPAMAVERF
jgi:hypothetical protein